MQLVAFLIQQPQWPSISVACQRQWKIWSTSFCCSKDHFMKIFHWININSSTSGFSSQRIRGKQNVSQSLSPSPSYVCMWCLFLADEVAASCKPTPLKASKDEASAHASESPWAVNEPLRCSCPLRPGGTGPGLHFYSQAPGRWDAFQEGRRKSNLDGDNHVSTVWMVGIQRDT